MKISDSPVVCPECNAVHADPVSADFTIHVLCAHCALEAEFAISLAECDHLLTAA